MNRFYFPSFFVVTLLHSKAHPSLGSWGMDKVLAGSYPEFGVFVFTYDLT
jgi:hypothetical protein